MRFCADGTLRGPDNCVVARAVEGGWKVNGRVHREFECEGPLRLRLTLDWRAPSQLLGPFRLVRTLAGMLYGDEVCLHVRLPGMPGDGVSHCHQITMLFEGGSIAKA